MSRRTPAAGTAAAQHDHLAGEIDDPNVLRHAMDGVDVVVHMAALLHVLQPARFLEAEYRRVNVGGTEAVMKIATERGVKRLILLSSIAVYGPGNGLLDESSPPSPDTPYGRTKLEAERVLLAGDRGRAPAACALRLAAVYGPSIKGNYERLVRALARRRFLAIGSGGNARTLVFEDDAARAMVLAATSKNAEQRIFNVTDGGVHTVAEIVAAIARALDRQPPRIAVPFAFARFTVNTVETLFRAVGRRPPVTKATLDKYVENVAVSGERIRRELGFVPEWNLADGWRETVRRLRQEGRV